MTPTATRRAALLGALAVGATVLTPTAVAGPQPPAIAFGPCPASVPAPPPPDRVECGTLRVPLDHRHPGGRHIDIAVSRVPASGTPAERRGVLLVNPGGPGGSGLPYAVTKRAKLPASVRRSYDVIGFDPRGTGRSAPADCGPMGGLFDSPGADPVPRGRTAERAHLDALHRMAADCAAGTGEALPHLSTAETVRDMDAIRTALGEPRIAFLGVSYGSYLGAAYAARYPRRVGAMVLDSVVGPWDWYDFDLRQSRALLDQRAVLFGWIAEHHERFGLGGTAAAVRAAYQRVRDGLADRPVDGFGAAGFDRAVYRALGRTERWTPLAEALRAYLRDGTVAGLRPAAPFDGPDSRTYEAANRAVKCADGPGPDPDRLLPDIRRLRRADPQPVLTGIEASVCAFWPHRPARRTPLGGPDVPPLLLIASEHDPVTPIAGARELRRTLPGSRLVTLYDDYSHGVFASRGNVCVDAAAAAYLVGGSVPAADVRCQGPGLPEPGAPAS
ncbi:alpha/beta hydrolase [Streptomyces sp. XD-27]|uniref:alpha/beta hydrolase n=1 Tax=Streptomyces sp. XD-27 TaxID=3062779 RepID=UPI0026F4286C|nr:alpha/beta hydrolase [Streptomyces sp. XD-27]WKX68791.1 alpha/beta hydrolase [Streptomyces sp. XD-27]